jgi:hypothetical protein
MFASGYTPIKVLWGFWEKVPKIWGFWWIVCFWWTKPRQKKNKKVDTPPKKDYNLFGGRSIKGLRTKAKRPERNRSMIRTDARGEYGRRLRILREMACSPYGLSLRKAAKVAGLQPMQWSRMERGKGAWTRRVQNQITSAFGKRADYFTMDDFYG